MAEQASGYVSSINSRAVLCRQLCEMKLDCQERERKRLVSDHTIWATTNIDAIPSEQQRAFSTNVWNNEGASMREPQAEDSVETAEPYVSVGGGH